MDLMQIFMGFLGSLGFGVLFHLRGKKLTIAACGGHYVDSLYGEESGITINRYDVMVK